MFLDHFYLQGEEQAVEVAILGSIAQAVFYFLYHFTDKKNIGSIHVNESKYLKLITDHCDHCYKQSIANHNIFSQQLFNQKNKYLQNYAEGS